MFFLSSHDYVFTVCLSYFFLILRLNFKKRNTANLFKHIRNKCFRLVQIAVKTL